MKVRRSRFDQSPDEDLKFEERRLREKKLKGLLINSFLRNSQKLSVTKAFCLIRGQTVGAAELNNSAAMSENRAALQQQIYTLEQ